MIQARRAERDHNAMMTVTDTIQDWREAVRGTDTSAIVDPDGVFRGIPISGGLTGRRLMLLEASMGEQTLQLVGALIPEVVLMDMHMPGWDGAETTKRILTAHPSTIVIGLSIQTDPHVAESMLNAGAAAFLQKETIGRELYSTIHTAVHRRTSTEC